MSGKTKAELIAEQKTWEERVIALEAQLTQAGAELAAMGAALEAREARIGALEKVANTFEAREAERKQRQIEVYLESLQADATALQEPLTADQVQEVRDLFAAGQDDVAKKLGDAYASLSRERAANKSAASPAKPLGTSAPQAPSSAGLVAGILSDLGMKAEAKDGAVVTTPNRIKI